MSAIAQDSSWVRRKPWCCRRSRGLRKRNAGSGRVVTRASTDAANNPGKLELSSCFFNQRPTRKMRSVAR